MTHTRLPVHVLTGFLGSGKTTLLSALLSQPALKDTLVIVNEIGEVSFDHLLLTEVGEEIVVQLEGGCVCCIVRGDLLRTLSAAHAQLSADGSSRFARVVIETSGLATPDAIIRTIMLDAKISTLYTLGRVAATYDCLHGADTLETFAEARAQVAAADTLVLTKLDLLSETQQDIAKSRVQAFNPGADICSGEEFLRRAGRWLEDANDIDDASLSPVESNEQSAFPHTEHIETFVLRHSLPIKRRLFNEWISLRLRFAEGQILRVKGIVHLCDADRPLFIHGVQQMFHPAKPLDNWPTNERETRLVFISKGVSQEIIERSFEKYVLRNGGSLSNPESQHTRPAASISR